MQNNLKEVYRTTLQYLSEVCILQDFSIFLKGLKCLQQPAISKSSTNFHSRVTIQSVTL
jgi:hypothetical protein